jgi:hypothetical protein
MLVAAGPRSGRLGATALVLGPLLLAAGVAVFLAGAAIRALGWDLAFTQGVLGLPLLLVSPGVTALAWTPGSPIGRARLAPWLVAGAIVAVVTAVLAPAVTQIGCQPVTGPLDALFPSALLGLACAAGFLVPLRLARTAAAANHRVRALVIGTGAAAVVVPLLILTFLALFPPLSCAAPRS